MLKRKKFFDEGPEERTVSEINFVENPVIIIRNGCVEKVHGLEHYSTIDLEALKVGTCPICGHSEIDRSGQCLVCGYHWGPVSCGAESYETIVQRHRACLAVCRQMAALTDANRLEHFRVRWCEKAQEITVQVEESPGQWLCLHDAAEG